MPEKPIIVPVGGFLGSGKTTLLLSAARILERRGIRPALLLNDQGDEIVDSSWTSHNGYSTADVGGGCFCCKFSDFIEAADSLRDADMILAEPVGSCTDLVATVLRPLQNEFGDRYRVAPLTVVVDPFSVDRIRSDADTRFLFEHQLAEADLVCCSRSDLGGPTPALGAIGSRRVSGRTGEGVEAWLDETLFGELPAGSRLLDIDYERYAAAEAALAWFNCSVDVVASPPLSPPEAVGRLMDQIDAELTRRGIRVAHLKILDASEAGALKAAITGNGQEPDVSGDLSASPASIHQILINLRALGDPDEIRSVVSAAFPRETTVRNLQSFRPSPPKPERRFAQSQSAT